MAKQSRKRQARGRGKTRRRKAAQARGAALDLKDRIPGYLFSPQEFAHANGGAYLPALFAKIPEDEILAALPRPRRRKRGPGSPAFPRVAMLRALVARQAYCIPSYAQLQVRLMQDVIVKHQCGFDLRKPSPDESTLAKFAQFVGQHLGALQVGHALLVHELGEHLPGLGERTSLDTAHIRLYVPELVEESSACTEDQATGSAQANSESSAGEPDDGPRSVTQEDGKPGAKTSDPEAGGHASRGPSEPQGPAPSSSSRSSAKGKCRSKGKSKAKSNKGKRQGLQRRERKLWPRIRTPAAAQSPGPLVADWGKKTYDVVSPKSVTLPNGQTVEGIVVKKSSSWTYGGKMALIVDNRWRLPLLINVTGASHADCPLIVPMYRDLTRRHRWMDCAYAMIDKAGDSEEVHEALLQELGIVGIIPLREVANRDAPAREDQAFAKTVYDRERVTHMHHPHTGEYVEFEPWGYDASRQAAKYVCPCRRLRASGDLAEDASCPFMGAKCAARHGRWPFSFWVPMSTNYRYYCPAPRESERWAKLYKERTTVERVNSVIKGPLGLGERRLRCLPTAGCEAALASVFLCARALVAVRWGVLDKVGSAVSALEPRPRYRATG